MKIKKKYSFKEEMIILNKKYIANFFSYFKLIICFFIVKSL